MQSEFNSWRSYTKQILTLYPQAQLFIKGGAILGLKCLSMEMCDDEHFDNFKKELGFLMKDWDMLLICPDCDDTFYMLNDDFKKEGETIIVMRYKTQSQRLMINCDALFEMAIRKKADTFGDLELPMTTMKIQMTIYNIDKLFTLMETLYLNKYHDLKMDYDYLDSILKEIDIIIDEYDENGLFKISDNDYDDGGLSNKMLKSIKNISNDNLNVEQFLISHIKEPDRLFLRLFEKNIHKSNLIKKYFDTNFKWLPNENFINIIFEKFIGELKQNITEIYKKYYLDMSIENVKILDADKKISILQCKLIMLELKQKNLDLETCIKELNKYVQQKYNFPKGWTYSPLNTLPVILTEPHKPNNEEMTFKILYPSIKDIKTLNSMQLSSLTKKIRDLDEYLKFSLDNKDALDNLNCNDIGKIKTSTLSIRKDKNKHVMLIRLVYKNMFNDIRCLFDKSINIGRLISIITKYDIQKLRHLKNIFDIVVNSDVIHFELFDSKVYGDIDVCGLINVLKKN
jgi:hypothetical protein